MSWIEIILSIGVAVSLLFNYLQYMLSTSTGEFIKHQVNIDASTLKQLEQTLTILAILDARIKHLEGKEKAE